MLLPGDIAMINSTLAAMEAEMLSRNESKEVIAKSLLNADEEMRTAIARRKLQNTIETTTLLALKALRDSGDEDEADEAEAFEEAHETEPPKKHQQKVGQGVELRQKLGQGVEFKVRIQDVSVPAVTYETHPKWSNDDDCDQ